VVYGSAPSTIVKRRSLFAPRRRAGLLVLLATLLMGCASAAGPAPSTGPSTTTSSGASSTTGGSAKPEAPIETPDEAARLVIASDSKFERVGKKDPDLIGQCCYYEAVRGQEGFRVRITVGWGDCPAGCIDHHTWTYDVSRDGDVSLIGQAGDPVPPGGVPNG
jgi:hypothetical protein